MSEHHHHLHHQQPLPVEEMCVLLEYYVNHNASHARELSNLARQLKDNGYGDAGAKTEQALQAYDKGNELLSEALQMMKEK